EPVLRWPSPGADWWMHTQPALLYVSTLLPDVQGVVCIAIPVSHVIESTAGIRRSCQSQRGRRGGRIRRDDHRGWRGRRRVVQILQPVAGERADHRGARVKLPVLAGLDQPGDARRRRELAEHGLLAGQHPVGGEYLAVGHRADEAARLVARLLGPPPGG